jgi:hypothetical protein
MTERPELDEARINYFVSRRHLARAQAPIVRSSNSNASKTKGNAVATDFIGLHKCRQEWFDLRAAARESFVGQLAGPLTGLQAQGVEVLGYGVNDPDTNRRAPYDFFGVYRFPESGLQRLFEAGFSASGWYDYFDQVNISGAALTPAAALLKNVLLQAALRQGPPIAASSRYAEVSDRRRSFHDLRRGKARARRSYSFTAT